MFFISLKAFIEVQMSKDQTTLLAIKTYSFDKAACLFYI